MEIRVYAMPGPQGSKRHVGRGIMIESSKKVKPWREAVVFAAREAMASRGRIAGPVIVEMTFTLPKPKSAPKTRRTWPATKPDVSKLARSTEDALVDAGIIDDDARIVGYRRLMKVYPLEGDHALDVPGAVIRIIPVEEHHR